MQLYSFRAFLRPFLFRPVRLPYSLHGVKTDPRRVAKQIMDGFTFELDTIEVIRVVELQETQTPYVIMKWDLVCFNQMGVEIMVKI